MRLIDADEFQSCIEQLCDALCEYSKKQRQFMCSACKLGNVLDAIENAPTVDAVPVVRCKDCLHNRACEIQYHAQAGDLFFCGAAGRKDGDNG